MRSYHNIETRPFPGHTYRVGYAKGIWHIQATRWKGKRAYHVTHQDTGERFYRRTLAEVSARLEKVS